MDSTIKSNIIKVLHITAKQYEIAYKYLYDEYGYTISFWKEDKIKLFIKKYLDKS